MTSTWNGLDRLNDQIDQLAAELYDHDVPEARNALALAWYYVEEAMRQMGPGSCGHVAIETKPYCAVCAHYQKLRARAEYLRGRLT